MRLFSIAMRHSWLGFRVKILGSRPTPDGPLRGSGPALNSDGNVTMLASG